VKIEEMSSEDHLKRAAQLMQMLDNKFDENGKTIQSTVHQGWTITPVQLTLADLHIGLAMAKEDLT
jgi:hypothetical protein